MNFLRKITGTKNEIRAFHLHCFCTILYLCNYKSQKFVFWLNFFIDGVKSAWPAHYFFSLVNHRLPVALYHFGKRFSNWPWRYFWSNWTRIFTTKMYIYCLYSSMHTEGGSFNRVLLIPWKHSCKQVLRNFILLKDFQEYAYWWNTDRTGTGQMEWIQNRFGTGTGRILCERVWNDKRTRSVKRSLLGFFWLVLYAWSSRHINMLPWACGLI